MKFTQDCPYCAQSFCLCYLDDRPAAKTPLPDGQETTQFACPGCGCLFCRCPPPVHASSGPPTQNIRVGRDTSTESFPAVAPPPFDVTYFYAEDEHLLSRNIFGAVEWV